MILLRLVNKIESVSHGMLIHMIVHGLSPGDFLGAWQGQLLNGFRYSANLNHVDFLRIFPQLDELEFIVCDNIINYFNLKMRRIPPMLEEKKKRTYRPCPKDIHRPNHCECVVRRLWQNLHSILRNCSQVGAKIIVILHVEAHTKPVVG